MSEHAAIVEWERNGAPFAGQRYGRGHRWRFDGGLEILASASPALVPAPWSVPEALDPEEAFVASLSSCHMLWFLSLAARRGWIIDRYRDEAVGTLARDPSGRLALTRVTLRPRIELACQPLPAAADIAALHAAAHDACFLARSVRAEVRVEPVAAAADGGMR